METEQGFNGWANRKTWNVMLWLDNDEQLYNNVMESVVIGLIYTKPELCKVLITWAFGVRFGFDNAIKTPDGVSLDDRAINWQEICEALEEWKSERVGFI